MKVVQYQWRKGERRPDINSPLWDLVDHPVDLTFVDPPYNYGVPYEGDVTGDKLPRRVYEEFVGDVVFQLANMTRDGGTLWWLCPAEDGEWMWPILTKYGELLHGRPIIWWEKFAQYQKKKLTPDYRLLFPLVVGGGSFTFNPDPIRVESERLKMGDPRANPDGRIPGHVWLVRRLQGTSNFRVPWHPVQLAPEPLQRIVMGWTNEGDVVLDAFAGSGSMGVICKDLKRGYVAVDESEVYCEKIKERLGIVDE